MFIAAKSYAKVNLCLAVSAPEPVGAARAGWHKIASWFHAVDLWDDVYVERATDGVTTFEREIAANAAKSGVIDWPLEKDLGFRAIKLLEENCGERLAVKVKVRKRIPSGGGLGGGSSNAATMLRTLNSLFGLGVESAELLRLSQKLGSDVAFFVDDVDLDRPPRPAIVRGFGESVERVASVKGELGLVIPEFGCATEKVYQMFDAIVKRGPWEFRAQAVCETVKRAVERGSVVEKELFNDLRAAAETVEPRLTKLFAEMERAGVQAGLSGSGSTMMVMGETANLVVSGASVFQTRLV